MKKDKTHNGSRTIEISRVDTLQARALMAEIALLGMQDIQIHNEIGKKQSEVNALMVSWREQNELNEDDRIELDIENSRLIVNESENGDIK